MMILGVEEIPEIIPCSPLPSVRYEDVSLTGAMTSSRSHSKLVEEPGPAAQILNPRPKLSSLMDHWFNLWNSEKLTSAEAAASEGAQKVMVCIHLSERNGKEKNSQH